MKLEDFEVENKYSRPNFNGYVTLTDEGYFELYCSDMRVRWVTSLLDIKRNDWYEMEELVCKFVVVG